MDEFDDDDIDYFGEGEEDHDSDDDDVRDNGSPVPEDIAIFMDRGLMGGRFRPDGSYLGRGGLASDAGTNAYREINGAADGHPGWFVDRYDKWLLVRNDNDEGNGVAGKGKGKGRGWRGGWEGPLPSIHDGNTFGVYYLSTGGGGGAPVLIEGRPAPDVLPVKENGVTYHVHLGGANLGKLDKKSEGSSKGGSSSTNVVIDTKTAGGSTVIGNSSNRQHYSTGLFLDQRLQRSWLLKNCRPGMRVLNCFAHHGSYSVAAAMAGADTVSLDLNKRFLDNVQSQMIANGIDYNASSTADGSQGGKKHDCIYGDCKFLSYHMHSVTFQKNWNDHVFTNQLAYFGIPISFITSFVYFLLSSKYYVKQIFMSN